MEVRHGANVRRCDRAFDEFNLFTCGDPAGTLSSELRNACRALEWDCPDRQVNRTGQVAGYTETVDQNGRPFRVPVPAPRPSFANVYESAATFMGTVATSSTPPPQQVSTTQPAPKPRPSAPTPRTVCRRIVK